MLLITQFCFYYISHLPLKAWFRPGIEGIEHIPEKPFILAANHTSRIDPFLLCLLPYSAVKRLFPIYFLTAEQYYKRWYLFPMLKLLGCYPVAKRAWTLHNFLSTTIKKVEAGKTIMFFPEGKIIRNGEKRKPRTGIGYLVDQTQKPILPLHIKWDGARPILIFGEVIIPNNKTKTPFEQTALEIMNTIYSL